MGSYTGNGYINAGIEVPAFEDKGKIILLVDSTHADTLSAEIARLVMDMDGDGWRVIRYDVSPNDTVPDIKSIIQNEYNNDPLNVKAVFLFGHIPVPYSGNLNPDGHTNHKGAWPCDAFYGEMTSTWTDVSVNNTAASDPRNDNIPGDGKYDQSFIPSEVELQVGRVDLSDMPAFTLSESELLRQYLNNNHAFRTKHFTANYKALIDDNFGGFSGEAFGSSGWKSFATMFTADSIFELDYFSTLSGTNYMWSYGCGAGSYTSASGIGNTTDFASDSLLSVFTCLFGSYFGDWDKQNNFLRAPLAQGITLTNAWSGRPHWHFHHMSLGENIGYSTRLAYNNNPYFVNYGKQFVHIALMGDPTLRMHIISPPSTIQLTENNGYVDLSWVASNDSVLGYYVYRKENKTDAYIRISPNIISGTTYTDIDLTFAGKYYYNVRAIKLEQTPSGTYYNLSQGVSDTITTLTTHLDPILLNTQIKIFPNPTSDAFSISISSNISEKVWVTIYSIDGKLVKENLFYKNPGLNTFDLSIQNKGIYMVQVVSESSSFTQKIIVQ
jgi:hypothetical protein